MFITIKIETFPCENSREYHVDELITDRTYVKLYRERESDYSKKEYSKAGERLVELADKLFSIEGISEISAKPYSLIVEKGKAFDWDAIESNIIETLKSWAGVEEAAVYIIWRKHGRTKN